jgi:Tfp pilus assembly protein PilV
LAGVLSLSSLFSGLSNVNAEISDNSLSKLTRDVIEFMDVNKNNAECELPTQESVYTGVGKSQKSLEDAKKIAANNAINFYKQETGGNQKPTNIKYQQKTTQASDTSKGISQTTYSVLAVLVF